MTLMPSSLSAPHKPPITHLANPAIAALHACTPTGGVRGGTPRGRSRVTQADYVALQLPAQIAGAPGRGTNHICSLPHCPHPNPRPDTVSMCGQTQESKWLLRFSLSPPLSPLLHPNLLLGLFQAQCNHLLHANRGKKKIDIISVPPPVLPYLTFSSNSLRPVALKLAYAPFLYWLIRGTACTTYQFSSSSLLSLPSESSTSVWFIPSIPHFNSPLLLILSAWHLWLSTSSRMLKRCSMMRAGHIHTSVGKKALTLWLQQQ